MLGALLVFMGAGCVKTAAPVSISSTPTSTPAGYIPTPGATTTQAVPEGWKVQAFGDSWSLAHPGVVQTAHDEPPVKTRARVVMIDLGTAVADAGEKTVPRRIITIDRLLPGDDYLTIGCVATSTSVGMASSAVSSRTAQGVGVCIRTENEAAAGNRYHTLSATVIGVQSAYVIDYVVHSVECANYDRPAEQCVPYDEARDQALFWRMLDTLSPRK